MSLKDRVHARRVRIDECGEIKDKTVAVSRVAKVVKGGRRFGFSALVVTGDGQGHVGYGLGKSAEVPDALKKASEGAKKSMVKVPFRGSTIPHDIVGEYGSSRVIMKPAAPGTGVIAGAAVRAVLEIAGVRDVRTKCIGSSNPYNVLRAVFDGLLSLKEPEAVASLRGVALEQMGYHAF